MNHPVIEAVEESLYLEDLLDNECKCERSAYQHSQRGITCSGKVTHRYITCRWDALICTSYAHSLIAAERWKFDRLYKKCAGCQRPAKDCWTIIPV